MPTTIKRTAGKTRLFQQLLKEIPHTITIKVTTIHDTKDQPILFPPIGHLGTNCIPCLTLCAFNAVTTVLDSTILRRPFFDIGSPLTYPPPRTQVRLSLLRALFTPPDPTLEPDHPDTPPPAQ